jgi:TonB-dependent starch-binding outer membrane protein SusC
MRKVILTMLVALGFALGAVAQDRTITGRVTDEKGVPLEGVSIIPANGKNGAKSDKDGNYSITVSSSAKSLLVSSVGFEAQRKSINGLSSINISLKALDSKLDEIVIVGYESKRKRDVSAPMSSVKGSEIANKPVGAFTNAMQGQMSGVQINSFNGVPGGAINVKIRGAVSIAAGAGGNVNPLYIIDGIQILSTNTNGLGVGNGFEATTSSTLLNGINADDIESIDVLKDPATASIYGAQAANGVVIITTKKGKQGKTKVNFNTYMGFSNVIKRLQILDATQAVQLGYEANVNRYGATAANTLNFLTATGGTIKNGVVDQLNNNDWQSLAFRQGFVRNYDLSVSGGNEKTTFLMSGGYNKMEGHVVGSDFEKGVFRLNLDHKIDSKFSVGSTLSLSSYTQNGVLNGGSFGNPVRNSFLSFPTNTPYLADGTYRQSSTGTWFGGIDNFLTYIDNDITVSNTKNLVGGINASYKISKNFTFRSTFSTNYSYTEEKQFNDPRYSGSSTAGSVSKFSRQITDFQTNHVLNYNQAFNGRKHVVTGLVGYEYRVNKNSSFGAFGQGLPLPQFTTLSSTATPLAPSEGFADFKLQGLFGKVGYTYNDKYIVAFTARRDGSSRFGKGNQYGIFPSASLAWRLSNEEGIFGHNFKEKNDIKLRFSYGITGSQDVLGAYGNRGLFGLSGEYLGLSGGTPTQLENKDLSWEENETYNAGIDISTLNKRVSLEVDIYKSNRTKLLLAVPIPATNGFSTINKNLGKAEVKGIDVGLKTININGKNFRWSTNFNFSYNKNKIIDLGEGVTQIGTLYKVGNQLNSIFTQKYAGVNPADGRPMYYDTLGNITYLPQLRDRYYMNGSLDPTFNGGMTNTISYKAFELRFQFIYQGGNYIQNSDAAFLQRAGSTFDRNQLAFQTERWQKPGDITRVPRPYAGGTQPNANSNSLASDRFFERGDFARLKEVTLTYNLSKETLSSIKLSAASFYVSGFNLATFSNYTGYDPELQGFDFGTYPQAKQIMFGINVTF